MSGEKNLIYLKKGDRLKQAGEFSVVTGYIACLTFERFICFFSQGSIFLTNDSLNESNSIVYEAKCDSIILELSDMPSNNSQENRDLWRATILERSLSRLVTLYQPTKERVLMILFQMASEVGRREDRNCYLPPILVQKEFAQSANCTREYFSGIRKELINEGWIADSKHWLLLDWNRWENEFGQNKRIRIDY